MKAIFPALFLGLLSAPFVHAADNIVPPGVAEKTPVETIPAADTADHAVPASGRVLHAQFTTAVKNHEPVDTVSTLGNDKTRISYFTEILGMAGQTVTHRWEYKDKVLLEMPFKVGSSHWRIYSTKTLEPAWLGEWKASVVDAAGSSLCVNTFTYVKAAAASDSKMSPVP